jgi:hypothetical protein
MDWATAIQPTRVLGLTMREPATLAHVLLLAEVESPVVAGGLVTIGDVALAAFVCAWPADKSRRLLASRWCPLVFRLWGRFWRPDGDAERLMGWLRSQIELPETWTADSKGRKTELAAPWWLNRLSQALEAGISYQDALAMPLRTLSLIVAARLEASGVVEFVSDRQRAYLEMCEQVAKRN